MCFAKKKLLINFKIKQVLNSYVSEQITLTRLLVKSYFKKFLIIVIKI